MKKHAEICQARLVRSRWAAIGAAVAVSLGGGGLLLVDAAGGSDSKTVLIDPVRILDTRDPVNVGLPGPFVSATSQKLQVTGVVPTTKGPLTAVPTGATGVLLNVTATGTTASGFISIRPGDATGAPATSSLNVSAGVTVPNAVLVALPTSGPNAGKIDITFDASGVVGPTTEILIDVVGFTTHLLQTGLVPSGLTVTGVELWDFTSVGASGDIQVVVELPGRVSPALGETVVNFKTDIDAIDDDAACTGTFEAPTAPPGKVCLYLGEHANVNSMQGLSFLPGFEDRTFVISALPSAAAGADMFFRVSWAYTKA